ncbi:hypothetical protein M427DRAFT_52216 [Gonapodya prolifera JEL478]|uniref:Uncharacterized protein n=1 Tax=Gonapodya prolifera (strain JEL478) TaxID=1344416 RepID=A0A139AVA3_GONPJ|nr:hypothetical protein M427DRAFT_52216 [Gonapodya prolifera JEL478]|eukprot:KXS20629.1 hypothetical protein M427DRAFT_52216 [Gonapodya prolifera JEL478]
MMSQRYFYQANTSIPIFIRAKGDKAFYTLSYTFLGLGLAGALYGAGVMIAPSVKFS